LFAIQSTLSCASAWEFSALSFEQPTVSPAPNVPNSTAMQKLKTAFHTIHENRIIYLCFLKRKYFCSDFETNIQSVKIYLPVAFIECDTSSEGNVIVWRNGETPLHIHPKWL